ncbi:MAG: hypothetical protein M1825_005729 [Sarcosagium campestre]|nr:MAG: hypothetical protein M1825_005729 [Sarcosagium campestre]
MAAPTDEAMDLVRATPILDKLLTGGSLKFEAVGNGSLATVPLDVWNAAESAVSTDVVPAPGLSTRSLANPLERRIRPFPNSEIFCYGSGSWAYDATIRLEIDLACQAFNYELAAGVKQVWKSLPLANEAGDAMSLIITASWIAAEYVVGDICREALMTLVTTECQGENEDTRGGEVSITVPKKRSLMSRAKGSNKAVTFTLDPTTWNCDC